MANQKEEIKRMVSDDASRLMLLKAREEGVDTCFDRCEEQKNQCSSGKSGVCCRACHMGPCRITPKAPRGICGANADTIAARNFLHEVTRGTAAHAGHGRRMVLALYQAAKEGGTVRDEAALRRAARDYGVTEEGRTSQAVALALSELFLQTFSAREENLQTLSLAPRKQQELWKGQGVAPMGVDSVCAEAMRQTAMDGDHDYKNLLKRAFRVALSGGWGGERVAAISSDIVFGAPAPVKSAVNLGVLREDTVNILIHGQEPALTEMIAAAARDPEMIACAQKAGAKGITLAGLGCTANEILMRHGGKVAGTMLQQELALVSGAAELMVAGTQCGMSSLSDVAARYHTEIVSAENMAETGGDTPVPSDESALLASAKALVKRAIDNFKNRDPKKMIIPKTREAMVAGFSVNAVKHMLGGRYRASFRLLNDAVRQNRITGVVGIMGCGNPKQKADDYAVTLARALIKRNVLVLETGCAAIDAGKAGLLRPETGLAMAGDGLRAFCEAVGIPPVLHMGGCADTCRLLEAATEIVREGGLGEDLSQLPFVVAAAEWMSEKTIAGGCCFVASGVDVILSNPFYVGGSINVSHFLTKEAAALFGGAFHTIEDPLQAAEKIMELLAAARDKLGIGKKTEQRLLAVKDRRNLNV